MKKGFNLDKISTKPNRLLTLLEEGHNRKTPMVLFGAGAWGSYYLSFIQKYWKDIIFCDNDPIKWGTRIENIPVISPEELMNTYYDCFITVTSLNYYKAIIKQLTEMGLSDRIVMSMEGFIDNTFHSYYDTIRNNKELFSKIYDLLSDNLSKQILYDRLNCCITGDHQYLIPLVSSCPQYFEEDLIHLNEHEIFIDGGSYTGDTIEEFLRQTGEKYEHIYAFEPETSKHEIFYQKFSGMKNIEVYPYGLWSKSEQLRFQAENSGSSHLDQQGNTVISVTSIDEVLQGKPVTFIKMDIEGAEFHALKGSAETIKKYKPKLAICVYHQPLDIVRIPLYVKELVPEYKIYLRHYNINIYETVCYATID